MASVHGFSNYPLEELWEEFYLETIWIDKEFYPSCINPSYKVIWGDILQEWSYTLTFYNTADFCKKVAAHCIELRINKVYDIDYNLDKPYTPQHDI